MFDKATINKLKEHNKLQLIYGAIQYSGGHMYIKAGYPFVKKNELRGHSGATGTLAYYCEETGMFFVGNLNQDQPYVPVNMMLKMEYCLR